MSSLFGNNPQFLQSLVVGVPPGTPVGADTVMVFPTDGRLPYTSTVAQLLATVGGGDLLSANNLSDVASISVSRTNLGSTAVGDALFIAATAAAARTTLGLGSAATSNTSAFDAAGAAAAAQAASQPLDGTLTALAALTIAADSLSIGTGADAFTQVSFAAGTFPAKASTGALIAKSISDPALTFLAQTSQALMRTMGLGSTTVGDAVFVAANAAAALTALTAAGLGANTFTALNTFSLGLTAVAPILLKDSTDPTKIVSLGMATISTGTTRNVTWPNAAGAIMVGGSQATNLVPFASSGQLYTHDANFSYTTAGGLLLPKVTSAGLVLATATAAGTAQTGTEAPGKAFVGLLGYGWNAATNRLTGYANGYPLLNLRSDTNQAVISGNTALAWSPGADLGTTADLLLARGGVGLLKFASAGSFSANATTATLLGSLGPAGAHTTVQKWLTIVDDGGTTGYIPVF